MLICQTKSNIFSWILWKWMRDHLGRLPNQSLNLSLWIFDNGWAITCMLRLESICHLFYSHIFQKFPPQTSNSLLYCIKFISEQLKIKFFFILFPKFPIFLSIFLHFCLYFSFLKIRFFPSFYLISTIFFFHFIFIFNFKKEKVF